MAGTIVEVTLPAEQFALERTLDTLETVTFEVEQMVATNRDRLMPFVWIDTNDRSTLEDAFETDTSVADFQLIADVDAEYLYQLEWVARIEHLVQILVEEKATILAATGQDDTWYLQLLFANRDAATRTNEYCEEHSIDFKIRTIQELSKQRGDRFDLTDTQQKALQLAADHGYYSVPREITTEELAEYLDVSHQALSERLRRGHGNLVNHILGTKEEPLESENSVLHTPSQETSTD